jgi:hypothetical protein
MERAGHPIIIAAAMDSFKTGTLRPMIVRGCNRPLFGVLVVRVSGSELGLKTEILAAAPNTPKTLTELSWAPSNLEDCYAHIELRRNHRNSRGATVAKPLLLGFAAPQVLEFRRKAARNPIPRSAKG